jgi:hypothetical protein
MSHLRNLRFVGQQLITYMGTAQRTDIMVTKPDILKMTHQTFLFSHVTLQNLLLGTDNVPYLFLKTAAMRELFLK